MKLLIALSVLAACVVAGSEEPVRDKRGILAASVPISYSSQYIHHAPAVAVSYHPAPVAKYVAPLPAVKVVQPLSVAKVVAPVVPYYGGYAFGHGLGHGLGYGFGHFH